MTGSARPPVFLTAAWRDLVLLNYEVDPAALAPRVPAGTVLDLWQGRCLASVVAFRFRDTRVAGWRVPFHTHFLEWNLRFYVRRDLPEGPRRGVVFVKEVVPRRLIAWVARAVYHEPYVALPMRSEGALPVPGAGARGRLAYGLRLGGRWHGLTAEVQGPGAPAAPDSEAFFLTEHYWGYTPQPDGGTLEYEVEHPSWRLWTATSAVLDLDAAALYGPDLARFLAGPPCSAYVADGSPVSVRRGVRLPTGAPS